MSFAVAVSFHELSLPLTAWHLEASWRPFPIMNAFIRSLMGSGQFVLRGRFDSPISAHGSCYGSYPCVGHFCVSLPRTFPYIVCRQLTNCSEGDSTLWRGCWFSCLLQRRRSTLLKSWTRYVSFDARLCCQSWTNLSSWCPHATVHRLQGGLRGQGRKVSGLPARCYLQGPLCRQTARLTNVVVVYVACTRSGGEVRSSSDKIS